MVGRLADLERMYVSGALGQAKPLPLLPAQDNLGHAVQQSGVGWGGSLALVIPCPPGPQCGTSLGILEGSGAHVHVHMFI